MDFHVLGILILMARFSSTTQQTMIYEELPTIEKTEESLSIVKRDVYYVPTSANIGDRIIYVYVSELRNFCQSVPSHMQNSCVIILSAETDTRLFVTEVKGEKTCNGISYKERQSKQIGDKPIGTFIVNKTLCPLVTPCIFNILWNSGNGTAVMHRSTLNFVIYPEQFHVNCKDTLKVGIGAMSIPCEKSTQHFEICPEITFCLTYKLTGPDKDMFQVAFNNLFIKLSAKENRKYSAEIEVSSNVVIWRPYERISRIRVSANLPSVYQRPYVETTNIFPFLGGTFSLACGHKNAKGIIWTHIPHSSGSKSAATKNEAVLTQYSNKQIISITNLSLADTGVYRCSFEINNGRIFRTRPYHLNMDDPDEIDDVITIPMHTDVGAYMYTVMNTGDLPNYDVQIYLEAAIKMKLQKAGMDAIVRIDDINKSQGGIDVYYTVLVKYNGRDEVVELISHVREELLQYFTSRQYLNGRFVRSFPHGQRHNEIQRNLSCEFVTCVEHRDGYSFSWKHNGVYIHGGNSSSFVMREEIQFDRRTTSICTLEYMTTFLDITVFEESHYGPYTCEMHIRYGGRVLPWIVSGRIDISQKIRASIYPKKAYVRPGETIEFYCAAIMAYKVIIYQGTNYYGETNMLASSFIDDGGHIAANVTVKNESTTVYCRAESDWVDTDSAELIMLDSLEEKPMCKSVVEDGITFPTIAAGETAIYFCPKEFEGQLTRLCCDGVWEPISIRRCLRKDLSKVVTLTEIFMSGGILTQTILDGAISDIAKSVRDRKPESSADILSIIDVMSKLSNSIMEADDVVVNSYDLQRLATVTDGLLSVKTSVWEDLASKENDYESVNKLLAAMDVFSTSSLLEANIDATPISRPNIVIKRGRVQDDILFPESEDEPVYKRNGNWVLKSKTKAFLPVKSFASQSGGKNMRYSINLYKNSNGTLSQGYMEIVSSDVLSFSLNADIVDLSPPLELDFMVYPQDQHSNPTCAYLDTSRSSQLTWSSKHCKTEVLGKGHIRCLCNHLTNFAILMSPVGMSELDTHNKALSIITYVGISLSIVCLVFTLLAYAFLWRHIKSDRSVLHLMLCISLLMVYLLFLFGIENTENQTGCVIITAFLHYFLLVVFAIMLTEGVELLLRVKIVFAHPHWGLKLFLPPLIVPVLLVGIAVGATWEAGYRKDQFCWLSASSGALWFFIGPACLVVLVNMAIVVVVMKTMLSMHGMENKENIDKAKAVLKSICVLTPILGLSWLFGIFAINQQTLVFQYLFAVLNTLQGLFIFIFHCLMLKQVRDGFRHRVNIFRSRYLSTTQSRSKTTDSLQMESSSK